MRTGDTARHRPNNLADIAPVPIINTRADRTTKQGADPHANRRPNTCPITTGEFFGRGTSLKQQHQREQHDHLPRKSFSHKIQFTFYHKDGLYRESPIREPFF